MRINDLTFLVTVFYLPIWLVWEVVVLKIRGAVGVDVGTISTVMRERAYRLNCIPFFWAAMTAHWWYNWLRHPTYDAPWPAVAFWLMVAGTLALDVALWNHPYPTLTGWVKVFRVPMVQCTLGFVSAYLLFPQRALDGPGWRWW